MLAEHSEIAVTKLDLRELVWVIFGGNMGLPEPLLGGEGAVALCQRLAYRQGAYAEHHQQHCEDTPAHLKKPGCGAVYAHKMLCHTGWL